MNKSMILPGLAAAVFMVAVPGAILAQEPQELPPFEELETREQVMQYIEQQAFGSQEEYQEASDLVNKLVAGTLTQEEADRLAELLRDNPGAIMMMAHRMEMSEMGARMRGMMQQMQGQMMGA